MKRILLLIMIFTVVFTNAAFASKYDYKNDNYNSKNIHRVIVISTIPDNCTNNVQDPYICKKLIDETVEKINKTGKVRATTMDNILARIIKERNPNFAKTYNDDPEKGKAVLQDMVNEYDAVLTISVLNFGYGSTYQEGTEYNTTSYKRSTVTGPNGEIATVRTPETTTHRTAGGNVATSNATVEFTLCDTKTRDVIFDRKDMRTCIPTRISDTEPIDMAHRMISNYIGDMIDKIEADTKK